MFRASLVFTHRGDGMHVHDLHQRHILLPQYTTSQYGDHELLYDIVQSSSFCI